MNNTEKKIKEIIALRKDVYIAKQALHLTKNAKYNYFIATICAGLAFAVILITENHTYWLALLLAWLGFLLNGKCLDKKVEMLAHQIGLKL